MKLIEKIDDTVKSDSPSKECHVDNEFKAAWYDETLHASSWWAQDFVDPTHAAMLLAGLNPNTASVEEAKAATSGSFGPDEFYKLKNFFEGTNKKPLSLNEWIILAKQKPNLRIHPWVSEWLTASGHDLTTLTTTPRKPIEENTYGSISRKHQAENELSQTSTSQSEPPPWLKKDPRDPEPEDFQDWYTPARYFARCLIKEDSSLFIKTNILANKIVDMLDAAGIKKQRGKGKFSPETIKKAFSNVTYF